MTSIRHWNIKNYDDAAKVLGDRRERTLGYATRLLGHGDNSISIVHHWTPIITYFPDGTFEVNCGGFRTSTTKERLNLFTPLWVWQKNYQWFVGCMAWDVNALAIPFEDGMRFTNDGQLVGSEVA